MGAHGHAANFDKAHGCTSNLRSWGIQNEALALHNIESAQEGVHAGGDPNDWPDRKVVLWKS